MGARNKGECVMKIYRTKDYDEMSKKAAHIMLLRLY